MTTEHVLPKYSLGEEIANSITHSIGVVYSIAGLAVLTSFASLFGSVWHVVSCSIYGATQILLYTTSTLYHSIPIPRAKSILRILDHSSIYLLIAGTYTPFTLVSLRGAWGWSIFIAVWSVAIVGISMQKVLIKHSKIVAVIPYIAMGWAIVIAIKPLTESLVSGGIKLLAAGGLAYTFGSIFYVWKKLPYHHAIWHLFVLLGSVCHFFAILLYVIPLAQ